MSLQNDYLIDPRTPADLRNKISELALSYTPEWNFDEKNPDVGSVIALVFANQMSENISKINQVVGKYHTEFVNMLNISLLPAYPAVGVAAMDIIQDTVPGVMVQIGTKLLGSGDDEDKSGIVFETASSVYIANSSLCDIYMVSRHYGKILSILGDASRPELVPGENVDITEELDEIVKEEVIKSFEEIKIPFPVISLFDYTAEGIERNAIMMYHKSAFNTVENGSLFIRFRGNLEDDISKQFVNPEEYQWSYLGENGLSPFDSIILKDDCAVLKKHDEAKKIKVNGEEYFVICIEALKPVQKTIILDSIAISSVCEGTSPDYVFSGVEDLDNSKFMPFGETASIFDECYIGQDQVFQQEGATITMKFTLSSQEKLVSLTMAQEKENLKIIKRKSRNLQFETANTSPQRVSFEYFNGIGWTRLICTHDWSNLFEGTHDGKISITFICPQDWQPAVIGGYNQRSIRMRVVQADNCYVQPCIHKMPIIENLTLSYSYFDAWRTPQRVRRVCGTKFEDVSLQMLSHQSFTAFSPLPYAGNALYLGFDHKMMGGPVSILFDIQANLHFCGVPTHFEYSALGKFERLKVIDHTQNMSGAGTVLFVPPIDFSKMEVEGKSRYWIRIVDERDDYNEQSIQYPIINSILLNAVEIRNKETMQEETFYIESAIPNMSFSLASRNILSTDVFVNEKNNLSLPVMRQMIIHQPDDIKVEYSFLGEISEFFVRWTEVDNFDNSCSTDRHYFIDRMNSEIHFGDGLSSMIPSASQNVSFTVSAVCCNGDSANLAKGEVNTSYERLLYINNIYNPIATYGGSNIESIENALERGANIVNSKNRLVSEMDFIREAKAFSNSIDKVKCVTGRSFDNSKSSHLVNIVVMMSDYADGPYSFNSMKDRLSKCLLKKCEATLQEESLRIIAPIYVKISVEVWVLTPDIDHSFEIQSLIQDNITAFLNPLSNSTHKGWEIGELPTEMQIRKMIHSIKCSAFVKYCVITAQYTDKDGTHEYDLSALKVNPFMIGINGQHYVHLIQSR